MMWNSPAERIAGRALGYLGSCSTFSQLPSHSAHTTTFSTHTHIAGTALQNTTSGLPKPWLVSRFLHFLCCNDRGFWEQNPSSSAASLSPHPRRIYFTILSALLFDPVRRPLAGLPRSLGVVFNVPSSSSWNIHFLELGQQSHLIHRQIHQSIPDP